MATRRTLRSTRCAEPTPHSPPCGKGARPHMRLANVDLSFLTTQGHTQPLTPASRQGRATTYSRHAHPRAMPPHVASFDAACQVRKAAAIYSRQPEVQRRKHERHVVAEVKRKRAEEKARQPRKPRTAYLFFSELRRGPLLAATPGLSFPELSKATAAEWHQVYAIAKRAGTPFLHHCMAHSLVLPRFSPRCSARRRSTGRPRAAGDRRPEALRERVRGCGHRSWPRGDARSWAASPPQRCGLLPCAL